MQIGKNQSEKNKTRTIVLTGPESTGKSTLVLDLAQYFNGKAIPEYARHYLSGLNRHYEYEDIELIARRQVEELKAAQSVHVELIFADTYLIITKVWFEVVYGTFPPWIDEEIRRSDIDLFLLCAPDIPWEPDVLRENGGEMRKWLFHQYEKNLREYGFNYEIVNGMGSERFTCAAEHIRKILLK